jgi:hypothetical protein
MAKTKRQGENLAGNIRKSFSIPLPIIPLPIPANYSPVYPTFDSVAARGPQANGLPHTSPGQSEAPPRVGAFVLMSQANGLLHNRHYGIIVVTETRTLDSSHLGAL